MNKFTLILAAVVMAFSTTTAFAMDGQADRTNEAGSYPAKTADTPANVRGSAQ